MECERRALENIAERRCGRDKSGVIVLSDSDEEAPAPSNPVRLGDPEQGCSKDGGGQDDGGGGPPWIAGRPPAGGAAPEGAPTGVAPRSPDPIGERGDDEAP